MPVRDAFETIEEALDYDGTQLVSLPETSTLPYTLVFLNDVPPETGYGYAVCGVSMWINANISADKFLWKVARHEMMHQLQATHGGRADSAPTGEDPTTMSTCVAYTEFLTTNFLDRDAEAYLNWLHSDLSFRQINSNIGFDNGTTGWGGTNGSISAPTSGGFSSPRHLAFNASGTSADSYARQTILLWVGDDTNDFEVRAYLRAKAPNSTDPTNVRAAVYRKNLSESGTNTCDYQRGLKNPNNLTLADMNYILVVESSLVNVDTSWTAVASDWSSIPIKRDGYQLQLRAYRNAAGADNVVRFDNVRMEER
ncbi:hypothetical protein GCM10025738_30770 [Microbacterium fluvii]